MVMLVNLFLKLFSYIQISNLNLVWIIDKDRNNIGKRDQSNFDFINDKYFGASQNEKHNIFSGT